MHHGPEDAARRREDASKAMQRLTDALELGATQQHPEGMLTSDDEGEIKIAIGVHEGKVVINFGKPVSWIGFSPAQARALAESIRKASHRAG